MKNRNSTIIVIILVIISILVSSYLIISSRIDANYIPNYNLEDFYTFPSKKLGVNEYKVVNVNTEEMAKTYFNYYISLLIENIDLAYEYLSEDYKVETYPNKDFLKKRIAEITENYTEVPTFSSYNVENDKKKGIVTYKIKDTNNRLYTFYVEAVMKYSVEF